ncbi:hypothetical protein J6590_054694 [Homalodisca vitripennis]|nr:hypothetical protein J6590_054694 [Homalodisca vitripennis]
MNCTLAWSISGQNYSRVLKSWSAYSLVNELTETELILFPLHLRDYEGGHWALVAVKPKLHLVRALDSLGHLWTKKMRIICNTSDEFPKQRNATHRRAFVYTYAEMMSAGDTSSGKTINPQKIRKDLARALRRGKISQADSRAYGVAGDRIAIRDLVPASSKHPLSRREVDDAGSGIVLPDMTLDEAVEKRHMGYNGRRELQHARHRMSAPATRPRPPTSLAVAATTCEDARLRLSRTNDDYSSALRTDLVSTPCVWKTKTPKTPTKGKTPGPCLNMVTNKAEFQNRSAGDRFKGCSSFKRMAQLLQYIICKYTVPGRLGQSQSPPHDMTG